MPLPAPSSDPVIDLGKLIAHRGPDELEAFLDRLHPKQRAAVERAIAQTSAAGWRAHPSAMAHYLTGGAIKRWRYVELLSRKFVDAAEGRSIRQIWNMPARYGKTLIASVWGPTWYLDTWPDRSIGLVSYGNVLARENSGLILDNIREHRDHLRVRLRLDRQRRDRFVTQQGGGLISAGIGSGLTGFGADGIIEDDPFANWQEAHSEAQRQRVVNHYRSVVRLRLQRNDSFIIIVMTRWHEEDLAGVLEAADMEGDGEGWEVVRLPAIAEAPSTNASDPPSLRAPDALGRKPGEVLEPERFDKPAVLARSRALGSYLTAGMEQQRPAPEEGGELKRSWWKWYTDTPPQYDDAVISVDTKLKDTTTGDFVVAQAWGRTGSDYWWLGQLRGQWNQVTTKTAIVLMHVRFPWIARIVVENTGNGPEVMQQLRAPQPGYEVGEDVRSELGITEEEIPLVNAVFERGLANVLPETPKGSKVVRARAYSGIAEAGNVHLPLHDPAAELFVGEAAAFPGAGAHDDMVDAWSQAMKRLAAGEASATAPPPRPIGKPSPSARALPAGQRTGGTRAGVLPPTRGRIGRPRSGR